MVQPPSSQVAPLPSNLPFRIVSRTIGQGAYAFIRKACPFNANRPVIAIKFINKRHAFETGKLNRKQLAMELALHNHLGKHQNIIHYLSSGEDVAWTWIAMELADGGDLFDKIEADAGVSEDVAHFYFTQLISAVSYMHSKGVAHRDIKPENILLSGDGDLKLADFGLAALFHKDGQVRKCNTVCGSPPYIAPEILSSKRSAKRSDILDESAGYMGNISDVWSCGIVLFVLLVGNTPWDEPTRQSYEFCEFLKTEGHTTDELWEKIPPAAMSLLRGMLKISPESRFSLDGIRTHPWFTQPNNYLSSSGTLANQIGLATQMFESLRIDLTAELTPSQRQRQAATAGDDSMDIDTDTNNRISATQPETPSAEITFDWERPARLAAHEGFSASQPTFTCFSHANIPPSTMDRLADDPALSQFSATPQVPISLTQAARQFRDILPAPTLARFLSPLPLSLLLPLIVEALHRLGVPARADEKYDGEAFVHVKTKDERGQGLSGTVVCEQFDESMVEVRFLKAKGDPLEWRRFFKKVVRLCKDGVLVPG
ncbi:serine/threonine-protein kinase Chk1 [Aulographum hederae CBS 113979]|uniref:non-specific serine/threonine protein kinase n=1 Tax=Aulographum hederae CBS 113979 TaxID=1176131 RepID=A0A6G1GQM1_9PEZI|nr:serine/threonine-protein kinase Chk1 [Aulographum hederae CBS 113979]